MKKIKRGGFEYGGYDEKFVYVFLIVFIFVIFIVYCFIRYIFNIFFYILYVIVYDILKLRIYVDRNRNFRICLIKIVFKKIELIRNLFVL